MFRRSWPALILFPPLLFALALTGSGGIAHAAGEADEPRSLGEVMDEIGSLHRALRRKVKDPAAAGASIEMTQRMQALSAEAMLLHPSMAADLPAGNRPAFLLAYKRQMVEMVSALLDLEEALLQNDTAKAQKVYRGLGQIKSAGHKKFQPEDA